MNRVNENSEAGHGGVIPEPVRIKILAALSGIRYGAVEIIIHDGKVIQIERKERVRLEK